MGQMGCTETSVRNYRYSLCNVPERRCSHLLRGGSLKCKQILVTDVTKGSYRWYYVLRQDKTERIDSEVSDPRCINPLTPNDPYRYRTAPLTSKVAYYIFILQI